MKPGSVVVDIAGQGAVGPHGQPRRQLPLDGGRSGRHRARREDRGLHQFGGDGGRGCLCALCPQRAGLLKLVLPKDAAALTVNMDDDIDRVFDEPRR